MAVTFVRRRAALLPPPNSCFLAPRRPFFYRVLAALNPPDRTLKTRDRVAPHYQIVYKGLSVNYVRHSERLMSLVVAVGASTLALSPLVHGPSGNLLDDVEAYKVAAVAGYLLATYAVTRFLSLAYVHRIYYSDQDDRFLLVMRGSNMFAERRLDLAPGALMTYHMPRPTNPLYLWRQDLVALRGDPTQRLLLNRRRFSVPIYYHKLLHAGKS